MKSGVEIATEAAKLTKHNILLGRNSSSQATSITGRDCVKGVNARRTYIPFFPLATQQFAGSALIFSCLSCLSSLAGVSKPFLVSIAEYSILIGFLVIAALTVEKRQQDRAYANQGQPARLERTSSLATDAVLLSY